MDSIKLCYSKLNNAGDKLNEDLVARLSGKQVVCAKAYEAQMMAIGGAIFGLQYSASLPRRVSQWLLGKLKGRGPVYIWGSGFLYNTNPRKLYRKNLKICALRGAKTKERLAMLTGKTWDVPLADAGLLSNLYLEGKPEKKYEVGIIPHFTQKEEPRFQKLKENFSSACIIDIQQEPTVVINQIARCRYILSSSLHGLIFADGLGVPNLHILGSTPLAGGSFKFEDYYSCYDLPHEPWSLDKGFPEVEDIKSRYCVPEKQVKEKQKQLLDCFPKL